MTDLRKHLTLEGPTYIALAAVCTLDKFGLLLAVVAEDTTNNRRPTMNNRKVLLPLAAAVMILVLMIGATMAGQQALGVVLSAILGALALVLTWMEPAVEQAKVENKKKQRR